MADEVEAKYRVEGFSAVRKALRSAGAVYLGTALQTDHFYDFRDRDIHSRGCSLRLRCVRLLRRGAGQGDARAVITFKGPVKSAQKVKIRREIETKLDCPEAAGQLLAAIGLEAVMTIQKRRRSYRLGRCTIELDELPLLGTFVEIEGPSERIIATARRRLGIEADHIPQSYAHLLAEHCKRRKLPASLITFEKYPSP